MTNNTEVAAAPGWYPDRLATIAFRWWDGQNWTEYVRHLEPSEWAITSVRVREVES